MKTKIIQRILAMVLVLCTVLPLTAFAVPGNGNAWGNRPSAGEPVIPEEPTVPEETTAPTEPEVPNPSISLPQVIQENKPITVEPKNYPEGSALTYQWTVDGVNTGTEATYTPKSEDREKWIAVTVSCEGFADTTAKIYYSNLPVVYLDFDYSYVYETKTEYVDGNLKIQGNDKFSDPAKLYDGITEVKGRGNTSWAEKKKPFKLKLDDKSDIFGMGKNKHWVLLANATDGSMMRNDLSYKLSDKLGLETYQDGTWVDVVIKDQGKEGADYAYYGTFYLCEHVRTDKKETRVPIETVEDLAENVAKGYGTANGLNDDQIDELTGIMEEDFAWVTGKFSCELEGETSGSKINVTLNALDYLPGYTQQMLISGGYLLELDAYFDEISRFKSSLKQPIMFNTPEFTYTNNKGVAYMKNFINSFEAAIQNPDFRASYGGKTVSAYDLFDIDALAAYWLIEELFMNEDGMKKSTYMYKPMDNANGTISKMMMGPVWDMDWSADGEGKSGVNGVWQTEYFKDKAQANQWYKYLVKDPYFLTKAQQCYWAHRDDMQAMIDSIDGHREYLRSSAAANAVEWAGDDGNWTGSIGPKHRDFDGAVDKLKTYLQNRLAWLDGKMTSVDTMGLYTPSGDVALALDENALTVNAPGAVKAEVLVNGALKKTISLTGGVGTVALSDLELSEERDVIYVVAYNKRKATVGTNYCYDQELGKDGDPLFYTMTAEPEKKIYALGETLDLKGMEVKAIYTNGSSEYVPNYELTADGFDNAKNGKQTIDVKYDGKSVGSFVVHVGDVLENGSSITGWENDYVNISTDSYTPGDYTVDFEVWESGVQRLAYGADITNMDFTNMNFGLVAKEGWKIKSVKYIDGGDKDAHKGELTYNDMNAIYNCPDTPVGPNLTLVIDLVRTGSEPAPVEIPLEDSFTATDCGTLTTEASGTANKLGFVVNKGTEQVFISDKFFTYDGALSFAYTAPEGFAVDSVTADNSGRNLYQDGTISNIPADCQFLVINLTEGAKAPFTLTCNKTIVRIHTNAIVYLSGEGIDSAFDFHKIKISENGTEITTFKAPVWDEATGSWKVYLMPDTLGKHTYTITVGNHSEDIVITGSKTGLSN